MSLLFEFKVFDPDLVHIFMHEKLLTNQTTFPERETLVCIRKTAARHKRGEPIREVDKNKNVDQSSPLLGKDVLLKRKKAESEAQRGKPEGTLESESRNAIV